MRISYLSNIPSPYFVERLNALALTVSVRAVFFDLRHDDRSWVVDPSRWRFDGEILPPTAKSLRDVGLTARRALRSGDPDLAFSLYGQPEFVAALGGLQDVPYVLRVVPTFRTWFPRRRLAELTKHVVFRRAAGAVVPGPDGAQVARRYGVRTDRIATVRQTIDVAHFARHRAIPPAGTSPFRFAYVGRLVPEKGIETLAAAYRQARAATSRPISLSIIGDGRSEDDLRRELAGTGSDFHGFVPRQDLPALLARHHALIFPTLGDPHGLVVEEAMATGLPVITSDAAGDVHDRVTPARGSVVPAGDADQLAAAMTAWGEANPARWEAASSSALAYAWDLDHERWAADMVAAAHRFRG